MARVTRSENDRLIIAYNIKKERKARFKTAGECVEKYGVQHSQWSPWESGRRTPDPKRLEDLEKFFKLKPGDLLKEPDNWAEEKARFLKERDKKKEDGDSQKNLATDQTVKRSSTTDDDGTDDYIQIVSMLAKVQSKFDKGEIDPNAFTTKMQSIREFVNFAYHGLVTENQPSE